jgi:predicted amidohydrolase YtcJ
MNVRQLLRIAHDRPHLVCLPLLFVLTCGFVATGCSNSQVATPKADLILSGGKVVTVDSTFSVAEAVAVRAGRIVAVGRTADIVSQERGPHTQMIDLKGRTVLPGLLESHVHPLGAALSEVRKPFVVLHSFDEVRDYIRQQAATTPKGAWIDVPKTFPARLKEMRMPDRHVLDATLDHPVYYDASYACAVNSYALRMSGITKATHDPSGIDARILRDKNGDPTGILTGRAMALLKGRSGATEQFSDQERLDALEAMLKRYLAAGLTSITDRSAVESIPLYNKLKEQQRLPVRVIMTYLVGLEDLQKTPYVTDQGDEWLKFGTFKVGLDGGINAGTSKMRAPWGPYAVQLFGIDDPQNRGDYRMSPEDLMVIMRVARDKGWTMAAHDQGDGAIDALLTVFETLNKDRPIAPTRSHLIHASFLAADLIERARKLGVLVDAQPGWLYFDGVAMSKVVSPEVMRYFNPYQSLVKAGVIIGGGSDHMVGWDKNTAVNPYNPFLNMWIVITRKTAQGEVIHPEERLTREQALRMYSSWSAYLNRSEKDRGSIETGKLADFVVIDRDYLTCPEDEIRSIEPLMTIVGGKIGYSSAGAPRTPTSQQPPLH